MLQASSTNCSSRVNGHANVGAGLKPELTGPGDC